MVQSSTVSYQAKENIIKELAGSYGLAGSNKKENSHYDPSTGTLFVGSRVYNTSDLERAKRFMRENKKKSKSFNDASCDLYEIGEIAIEALIQDSAGNGGRIIIKDR